MESVGNRRRAIVNLPCDDLRPLERRARSMEPIGLLPLWMPLLPNTASREVDQMVACAISESVE